MTFSSIRVSRTPDRRKVNLSRNKRLNCVLIMTSKIHSTFVSVLLSPVKFSVKLTGTAPAPAVSMTTTSSSASLWRPARGARCQSSEGWDRETQHCPTLTSHLISEDSKTLSNGTMSAYSLIMCDLFSCFNNKN